MTFRDIYQDYIDLTRKADIAFKKTALKIEDAFKCGSHCSECCHAVFGVFLIEACQIKNHFDMLDRKIRHQALKRGEKADKALQKLSNKFDQSNSDQQRDHSLFSKTRIRCPLLDNKNECIIYPFRPITCRVYGIPTIINGTAHVCGKSGFKRGVSYPAFNLDGSYEKLYQLSMEFLKISRKNDLQRASLMLSISKVIKTPIQALIAGHFE